jgi:8-oxo-dGTP pyrophosphatase MutT (NUDIX family)
MNNRIFRAATGAFIYNQDAKLLVILKHNYINKLDIVKGGIDFNGENEISALTREIDEELGIKDFKIIKRSMIPKVFLKPSFDWANLDLNDYVGQAQVNYWVFIDKNIKFNIPNQEIEQYKWIDINKESISEHFNIHDAEGTYQNFLPLEWTLLKNELLDAAK